MKKPPFFQPPRDVVYAIRKGRDPGGPIKIGYTAKINRRYAELQAEHKELLKFLAVIPGTMRLEKALHFSFMPWSLGFEWFASKDLETQKRFDAWWQRIHCEPSFQESVIQKALAGTLGTGDVE